MAKVKLGRRSYHVPGPKPVRIAIGVALVLGGMLGFLPVLGFWMIPLGLVVLSVDSFRVRRLRRRLEVWWGRRGPGPVPGTQGDEQASGQQGTQRGAARSDAAVDLENS